MPTAKAVGIFYACGMDSIEQINSPVGCWRSPQAHRNQYFCKAKMMPVVIHSALPRLGIKQVGQEAAEQGSPYGGPFLFL